MAGEDIVQMSQKELIETACNTEAHRRADRAARGSEVFEDERPARPADNKESNAGRRCRRNQPPSRDGLQPRGQYGGTTEDTGTVSTEVWRLWSDVSGREAVGAGRDKAEQRDLAEVVDTKR